LSILVDKNTRLLVQGITGREGSFQTRRCIEYGTDLEEGERILRESNVPVIRAADLGEAAQKAVEAAG
jgi:succinyl-CoA synthetase alpha subunit